MFEKWRRKREKKRVQNECPNDWHVVRGEYLRDTGFLSLGSDRVRDVYCPICEKSVNGVPSRRVDRELKKQDIRQRYFERK